jgi:hypothetical protein
VTLVPELTHPDGPRAPLLFVPPACPRQGTTYICAGTTCGFAPAAGNSGHL